MIKVDIHKIAEVVDGDLFSVNETEIIAGFSIDSRTIKPGDLFIAVKGDNFDGHDYIREALRKGASGIIAERSARIYDLSGSMHTIMVGDTRKAMGRIAAYIRDEADIPVVCITGTNGKTTVKDVLSRILSSRHNVLSSPESYNNIIGLSLTMFGLEEDHDVIVLEMGTNHTGEISVLSSIARPDIVLITNIGEGHLEAFNNKEGVFYEKISALNNLTDTGMAILNMDDPFLSRDIYRSVRKIFFGKSSGSDYRIDDVKTDEKSCSFSVNGMAFEIPLAGEHNIYNAVSAIAAAQELGIPGNDIRRSLAEVSLPYMRLERLDVNGVVFFNDSYNANPGSFRSALDVLTSVKTPRKGVVAGDMLELGEKSRELHIELGRNISERGMDFLIAMGDNADNIISGAVDAGMDKESVVHALDHNDAADKLKILADRGSAVLLKGSRRLKMEEILKCFTTSCIP